MCENYSKVTREYLFGTWKYQKTWNPKVIVKAEGSRFTDSTGMTYLDFSSQLVCSNLGHSNKAVKKAIAAQGAKLSYIAPGFTTPAAAKLARKLAEVAPGDICKSYFSLGGAEANEAAMKIARFYTRAPKLIARFRSYHGATSGAISLTGDPRRLYAPVIPGTVHAPDVYCYRCPFGLEHPGCEVQCAEYIGDIIEMEGAGNVAALFVEPIVGSNGILVPPDDYMPRLREICTETGTLLVADEVMTGFGRTGEWFCVNHWDVVPDMITMAKGLTSAYVPFSATMVRKPIADYFEDDNLFCHGQTYANHPIGCAAGLAAVEEYQRLDLVSRTKKMGRYLGKRLGELQDSHPSVGEVRGKGLFWGIEPVKNRETKEPFATRKQRFEPTMLGKMAGEALKRGVYFFTILNTMIFSPPLIVTEEEIDEGVVVIDDVLKLADAECI
ncbi:MAG: aminotransferase class III-fold pyridoxal phosphate-dependent enzyme [Candidatus Bathyarchaeota archaeon]|jgi:taurine--2-oxoglutarate transaminase|nr:aminotransferase class III-fold pyridoxal phosphate-dependent enzyme [Candidatus Bathyarchaeota archaeon]